MNGTKFVNSHLAETIKIIQSVSASDIERAGTKWEAVGPSRADHEPAVRVAA